MKFMQDLILKNVTDEPINLNELGVLCDVDIMDLNYVSYFIQCVNNLINDKLINYRKVENLSYVIKK